MLKSARSYEEACRTFRWRIPERYNLAFDVCDRQTMAGADGHRTALIVEAADGTVERHTFHVLRLLSNRAANVLAAQGIGPGDRVAAALSPSVAAAALVLAALKMGAILVPVAAGLGIEPVVWRLADSGARLAVADEAALPAIRAAAEAVDPPVPVIAVGEAADGFELWSLMERASDSFAPVVTAADDPAFIFYPAHACGRPPGAVHAHRSVPGSLPALEFALGFFPQFGDVFWNSADPMTAEGLLWGMLAAWHHGVPVVARQGAFDAEAALGLAARHGIRAAWVAPYHLALLTAAAEGRPHPWFRALATGPEPLGAEMREKVREVFRQSPAETWGTVASGAVAANNAALMELRPGSPGRATPGVTVEAVDETGRVLPAGGEGELAVAPGAPGGFLGWWGLRSGDCWTPAGWLRTGSRGSRDLDGYLWPAAPPDRSPTVGGLAVSLAELSQTLAAHPRVADAAAVMQGGDVKAYVVPLPGDAGDLALARDLQAWATARRAAHETPRRIEFVIGLPRDADGALDQRELAARAARLDAISREDRLR